MRQLIELIVHQPVGDVAQLARLAQLANFVTGQQQDPVGGHRAGEDLRHPLLGQQPPQVSRRIGFAQLVLQAPAKGHQIADDAAMGIVFRRQDIAQLTHQRAFGDKHRPPQIARLDEAAVAGAVAKAEENRNRNPQQAERRHG